MSQNKNKASANLNPPINNWISIATASKPTSKAAPVNAPNSAQSKAASDQKRARPAPSKIDSSAVSV